MHGKVFPDGELQFKPGSCVTVDFEGRIVRASPTFCRVVGRGEDELRAVGLLALLAPPRRTEVAAALARMGEQEALIFDLPLVRPDGDERSLEWHGVVLQGERAVQFIVHDATSSSSWRAEAEVHERERFLETLLANLPGMVYRSKNDPPEWTMEFLSAGCEALTGYTVEDLVANKTTSYGRITHPEDAYRVVEEIEAKLSERQPFSVGYRILKKSGEERQVQEQGRGVFSASGELVAIEGFVTDVTARVRAEQELRDKLAVIEAQREQIRLMSLPIIEVADGVLTLPVVGELDAAYATRIMEGLLDAVVRMQCRHVIVDLTAVASVDAQVATRLVGILRAVGLLGARGVFSGIRPTVARALVESSIDLGGIPTLPDLRAALASCLRAPLTAPR